MAPRRNTCTSTGRLLLARAAWALLPSTAAAAAAVVLHSIVRRVKLFASFLMANSLGLVPLETGERGGEGDRFVQGRGAETDRAVDVGLQVLLLRRQERAAQESRVDALRETRPVAREVEVELGAHA